MSKVVKLKEGLNVNLIGKADKVLNQLPIAEKYAIKPTDFSGLTPKMSVKVGDKVLAGQSLFFDKYMTEVQYTSPVSGEVVAINRGERRKLLEVVVKADKEIAYEQFNTGSPDKLSKDDIVETMLKSGVWPFIKQRPFGTVANPKDEPKAIFISGFDTAPLAPDYSFIAEGQQQTLQVAVDALKKLTGGKVYVGVDAEEAASVYAKLSGVEVNQFQGKHPAGNVGVQIHHISPMNKGEVAWTINAQDLLILGRLFEQGKFDASRTIALTGPQVEKPTYYKVISGASVSSIVDGKLVKEDNRIISGNALTGTQVSEHGFLGFYDSQITVLAEGRTPRFLGWGTPGFGQYSVSRTFFSWLCSKKEYALNTAMNGGKRAFVVTGQYDKVVPMDVLPVQLLKACIIEDVDMMEQLGIYEVIEEDLALCEFVCTSKIEVQEILRKGLDLIKKEFS